ncbi:uncharacterized protein [Miscanthus floridulus]|uniref:uncharacterized protein n=1 Tax=Miscanthus floridulus TaxID=154761 RepID=UPI0034588D73
MEAIVKELCTKVGAIRKTEASVESLREEMTALRKSVSRTVLDAAPAMPTGVLPSPTVTATKVPVGVTMFSPIGHREESSHQGFEFPAQSPIKDCADEESNSEESSQLLLAISMAASAGTVSADSIQFMGAVQGQPALANGTQLLCSSQFLNLQWSMQDCEFVSDVKVLPLTSFELIMGMDWLVAHSPMQVDRRHKWLLITLGNEQKLLQGSLSVLPPGSVVQITTVLSDDTVARQEPLPPEVAGLLLEFQSVFAPPTGYPPERDCDHAIPLLPGATPFSVHPYRYPPAIKDEIERKIIDMLQSAKIKYPVPVIEELLDELTHASWFSCLDLTAGYHQIRLKPGEEFKTAVQMHTGQYEFLVMAFGLTGAPGTFLKAMNTTSAPLLQKCVLVFFNDILIYSRTNEEHLEHIKLVLQLLQRDHWQQGFGIGVQLFVQEPSTLKPDFSKPFVVETDASGHGIGAVLMQNGHRLAFLSKALGPRSRGLSTYEKEYMAILMALEQWRSYLQHAQFQIIIDHRSLVQLTEQRLNTPWQQKMFTKLMGLQYQIIYRKGVENGAADALSRCPPAQLAAMSWRQWFNQTEFCYNTTWHSALGRSPFEVLYGYPPRQFGIALASDLPVTDLSTWLTDRALMTDVIRQHLNQAMQRMKRQADTQRSERQFQVGDMVYVKIQPYVQSSLAQRSNQKLSFEFFGPYRVIDRVGSVAYRLDLPASSSVHLVFHVSQLKKSVGARHSVTAAPPSDTMLWSVPERILQNRSVTKGTRSIAQGLIKWSNLPVSLATWEDLDFLRQQFHRATVWSCPGAQGGGSVMAPATVPHLAEAFEDSKAEATNEDHGPRRSSRPRAQNPSVMGPEWMPA